MALGRQRHVHYNQVLTNLAVDYAPMELVARQILPVFPVVNATDVYPVFDKRLFDDYEDLRADGDESNEVSRGWKYVAYMCESHALKEHITKKMRANWDSQVDLEGSISEDLKQLVWNRYEKRVLGSGGILRTTTNNIHSANVNWTNLATATVKGDLDTAKEAIEAAASPTPNVIVLTPQVARHIANTTEWKDYHKYTANIADDDLPKSIYGLRPLYVKAVLNTAKKGQAATLARVWGKHTLLAHVNKLAATQGSLTFGFTAQWGQRIAGTMEDKNIGLRGGQRARVGESVKELISAANAAYFVENAVA